MGKKRKAADGAGQEEKQLVFDAAARQTFLGTFRKRRQARRKRGRMDDMEKERKDKIDVRREVREEIKKRYKDVLWAERTVDRVLTKRALMWQERKLPALRDKSMKDSDDGSESGESFNDFAGGGDGWIPAALLDDVENAPSSAVNTISFQRADEEDDPFGDCEVTTTAVAVRRPLGVAREDSDGVCGSESEADDAVGGRAPSSALAVHRNSRDGEPGTLALSRGRDKKHMTEAELEEHRRKRALALKKEEARRRSAMEKEIKHRKEMKKREKKKSKKSKEIGKGGKMGAKARRRRAKKG